MNLQKETQKLVDLYIKAFNKRSVTFDYKGTYQRIIRNSQMLGAPAQEIQDFLSDYTVEDAERMVKTVASDMGLVNKINDAIDEFRKNLRILNTEYDIRKGYQEIYSLVKELEHPTPKMLNFIEQIGGQIEQQIHDHIVSFRKKAQEPGYDYQKEYFQIYSFIKKLRKPTQEMLDFIDNKMLETGIESKIKEFNSNLYKLSNSFDFLGEYTKICDLIKQIQGQTTCMLDFMRVDINKIINQQKHRINLPHRFSQRKYIPKRKWDECEHLAKALEFSKKLLDYKNYSVYELPNQNAFDDINKIFFYQLTDIIQKIRDAFGYDVNIVFCACPSSKPDKKNTVQLSITEYAKINKTVIDGNDLLVKIHSTEPAHLSGERDFATLRDSIKLNEQKYTKDFFNRRNVFVICDDIYTTGTTMKACRWHLEPKQVIDNSIFEYTIAETLEFQW